MRLGFGTKAYCFPAAAAGYLLPARPPRTQGASTPDAHEMHALPFSDSTSLTCSSLYMRHTWLMCVFLPIFLVTMICRMGGAAEGDWERFLK